MERLEPRTPFKLVIWKVLMRPLEVLPVLLKDRTTFDLNSTLTGKVKWNLNSYIFKRQIVKHQMAGRISDPLRMLRIWRERGRMRGLEVWR